MNHPTHGHNHTSCQHCFHWCDCCKVVYCCKCGEQWGNNSYFTYYPPVYPNVPVTWTGGTVTWSSSCSHGHC